MVSPTTETDPFLQQSNSISITAEDRQEGYDVDLLNSAPRTTTPNPNVPKSKIARIPVVPIKDSEKDLEASESARRLNTSAGVERNRAWFMRPLILSLVALIILALALGIGLGVGLGMKHTFDEATPSATATYHSLAQPAISTPSGSANSYGIPVPSIVGSGSQRPTTTTLMAIPSGPTNKPVPSSSDITF